MGLNKYKFFLLLTSRCVWSMILLLAITSCKKFVAIEPPRSEIVSETVFTSDGSATSAMRGIYSLMITNQSFTNGEIERYTGLSADELINYSTLHEQIEFYNNSILPTNGVVLNVFWREAYKYINNANAILEGLSKSSTVSPAIENQLEGEAKFIRAFCHFNLVNLFGDVPLVLSTDYRVNSIIHRSSKVQVLEQIISDLKDAKNLISSDYIPPTFVAAERVLPNKSAVSALLARVYLYSEDWQNAETQATSVIDNSAIYNLEGDLNNVFLANSREAIWQLKPVIPESNTTQARLFVLFNTPNNILGRVSLSSNLYNSFESGDMRKTNWVGAFVSGINTYYYPNKYKVYLGSQPLTEYAMILRLAEQYLIRAEARIQQNNIQGAQADLNMIRRRAELGDTPANDKTSLLIAIYQERKIELFTEWGHHWFDLKRTNRADAVLSLIKGANWQSTDVLYPIPESERLVDPNLTQNAGY